MTAGRRSRLEARLRHLRRLQRETADPVRLARLRRDQIETEQLLAPQIIQPEVQGLARFSC